MTVPLNACAHTPVPRHVCVHTRLCRSMIFCPHDHAHHMAVPDTFVPIHDCAHTIVLPRHVCFHMYNNNNSGHNHILDQLYF